MIIKEKIKHNEQITYREQKNDSQSCQHCDKPAMCNIYTCYKQKQTKDGEIDCSNCEERLCQQHWRIYFKQMM